MSVLILTQIHPETVYAQEETADVILQTESAAQETAETDIADTEEIETNNQIEHVNDSEVPESDNAESTETEVIDDETESETEVHTITGVQDLPDAERRIDIAYADKPSLEELVSFMPKTMDVYLDGGKEVGIV